jgi:PIN domain nuclease of toxin-antitoxin system
LKLLLDSHVLLWWPMGSSRLGKKARTLIQSSESELFMSAASWWELGLKVALKRLDADLLDLRRVLIARDVLSLPVSAEHAETAASLPVVHRDPFDHMLVAQSIHEGLHLLTRDKFLKPYGPAVICL